MQTIRGALACVQGALNDITYQDANVRLLNFKESSSCQIIFVLLSAKSPRSLLYLYYLFIDPLF